MRPVNLIPADERRGAARVRPTAGGRGAYVVLCVLAVLVLGVFVLTSTNNQINERKSKQAKLEKQNAQAKQATQKLAAYSTVQTSAQGRFDAVYGVVKGRFDFERRLRQLTHVIPDNVSITSLKATASSDAGQAAGSGGTGSGAGTGASNSSSGSGSAGDSGGRAGIPGPAFEMSACTDGNDWPAVAVMMTRMRNIDGVTKILVSKPTKPDKSGSDSTTASSGASSGGGSGASSGGGGGESTGACKSSDITFDLVVGFVAPLGSVPSSSSAPTSTPTAIQKAGTARQTADQAAQAAGSDQSGGGSTP